MPMATISVTEDMATAMRLHGLGWRSVYHHEILAHGLAPEDLRTMLTQRLRWAQGTMQVLLRENPLLSGVWPGAAADVLRDHVELPVRVRHGRLHRRARSSSWCSACCRCSAFSADFFCASSRSWWSISCCSSWWPGAADVARTAVQPGAVPDVDQGLHDRVAQCVFGRPLGFAVTPKVRQDGGPAWHLIRPQLVAMVLLAVALVVGTVRLATGLNEPLGTLVNVVWVVFDLVVMSVLIKAARYRGHEADEGTTDAVHR